MNGKGIRLKSNSSWAYYLPTCFEFGADNDLFGLAGQGGM
jgi:hypothetical protein